MKNINKLMQDEFNTTSIDEYIRQINLAIKRMYKVDEFTFTVEELSAVSFKLANAFKSTKEDDILSI